MIETGIFQSLERISQSIGNIYLDVGDKFAKIFRELESGFQRSNFTLSHFEDEGADVPAVEQIAALTRDAEAVVQDASRFFLDMNQKDDALFDSINQSIRSLHALESRIESIREDSMEMEIISLNAMTIALKAGSAGRAFSYITEELQKLSARTISYANELDAHGRRMLDLFAQFQVSVEEVQEFQKEFFAGFRSRLHESFESINRGLNAVAQRLNRTVEKARSVSDPLFRINDELQLQDIIKQSLDHVVLSLKQLGDLDYFGSDPLEQIGAAELLVDLCIKLLNDIQSRINGSFEVFRQRYVDLRAILESVEAERKSVALPAERPEGRDLDLNAFFDESVQSIRELLSRIDQAMVQKDNIASQGRVVERELKLLENSIVRFYEIVDRYYGIEVVSRIEVAKQEVLRDRSQTIMELAKITDQIEHDVDAALSDIKDSLKKMSHTLRAYKSEVEGQKSEVGNILATIQESQVQLVASKSGLESSLGDFSLYTDDFFSLLRESEEKIEKLHREGLQIDDLTSSLKGIHSRVAAQKKDLMAKAGLEKWDAGGEKLVELVSKFTILTHKQLAADLTGFKAETGDREGALTLF